MAVPKSHGVYVCLSTKVIHLENEILGQGLVLKCQNATVEYMVIP